MGTEADTSQAFVSPRAFVRTYNPPNDLDPWELVQQYREVIEVAAAHPDLGSSALSNRLDIPRSRLRGWVNDEDPVIPDCVRGLHQAQDRGWIRVDPRSVTFAGLNILVASVFAGGSLGSQYYSPLFSIGDRNERELLERACAEAGVTYVIHRETEPNRATELRPTGYASVLGRVLSVFGAPIGEKAVGDITLPAYLDNVDMEHRRAFARAYVITRGSKRSRDRIGFREERNKEYLNGLADLLRDVTDETVWQTGKNVVLSGSAVDALFQS